LIGTWKGSLLGLLHNFLGPATRRSGRRAAGKVKEGRSVWASTGIPIPWSRDEVNKSARHTLLISAQ
jgi:hypothetical protein